VPGFRVKSSRVNVIGDTAMGSVLAQIIAWLKCSDDVATTGGEESEDVMRKTAVLVMVVAASVAFALGELARVGTPMAVSPAASQEAGLINPTVATAGEPGTWRGVPAFAVPTFDHVGWKPVQSVDIWGQIIDTIIRILGQIIDRHK
jgi:hypothetical protein